MEISFTFRHLEPSEALKGHALAKLQKLNKYLIKPIQAHVILGTERFQHRVEVTLTANGIQYVSHEASPDMYTSIDKAIAKLERQLREYKERLKLSKKHFSK